MSARHTSQNTVFSRYGFKKKKSQGAAHRGAQTVLKGRDPWSADSVSPYAALEEARPFFLLVFSAFCSSLSPAATGFYLHCSLKPSSQCAARPSTRSQPATSSEAATHNYNQLLRAAGWPALQSKRPDTGVPGRQQPALGSSEFSEGSAHTLGG